MRSSVKRPQSVGLASLGTRPSLQHVLAGLEAQLVEPLLADLEALLPERVPGRGDERDHADVGVGPVGRGGQMLAGVALLVEQARRCEARSWAGSWWQGLRGTGRRWRQTAERAGACQVSRVGRDAGASAAARTRSDRLGGAWRSAGDCRGGGPSGQRGAGAGGGAASEGRRGTPGRGRVGTRPGSRSASASGVARGWVAAPGRGGLVTVDALGVPRSVSCVAESPGRRLARAEWPSTSPASAPTGRRTRRWASAAPTRTRSRGLPSAGGGGT